MITPPTGRTVSTQGVQTKGNFGISRTDEAHLMTILRDTLYSDKVLAVLREYSANAWDAHRQAGKHALPIKVTLPTAMHPVLTIRDFGLGLSDEDVFTVYAMYGASTKRQCNDAVGFLGIGSKSGFSYSDSFTITSWFEGMKRVYVAVLDASEVGEIQRLHEAPCDAAEVGVEIQIPVKPDDVYEFQTKARNLFRFFEPQPDINLELPKREKHVTPHGYVAPAEHGWTAIMGCVPYRLDPMQVQKELTEIGLWDSVQRLHGGLYFTIGEVTISASREDLKYSDVTKRAVVARFESMIEAYVEDVLACLATEDLSPWTKRLKGTFMATTLKAPIPERYREWARVGVPLYGDKSANTMPPAKFRLTRKGAGETDKIQVAENARLLLKDDPRDLDGFQFKDNDTVVHPINGYDLTVVQEELTLYLDGANLTGMPVERLSSVSWYEPVRYDSRGRRKKGPANPKHKVRSFKLRGRDHGFRYPWSEGWEVVNREPTDDDVFVVMSSFEVHGLGTAFYATYEKDRRLAKQLKADMPEVYGYKSTEDKPVTNADCKGTHYSEWRKAFFRSLLTKEHRELLVHRQWRTVFDTDRRHRHLRDHALTITDRLRTDLGPDHLITEVFRKYTEAVAALRVAGAAKVELIDDLANIVKVRDVGVGATLALLLETYPLFTVIDEGLNAFNNHPTEWINYVNLVDGKAQIPAPASKTIESEEEIDA